MQSLNKVTLIGHVGADPEIKMFSNGNPNASFSLATSYSWKDKSTGEKKTQTDWHRIVCFSSALCAIIQQYVKKGSYVYIEGSLKTREWEGPDKQKKFITEVVLNDFSSKLMLLNSKDQKSLDYTKEDFNSMAESPRIGGLQTDDKKASYDLDDEIPF